MPIYDDDARESAKLERLDGMRNGDHPYPGRSETGGNMAGRPYQLYPPVPIGTVKVRGQEMQLIRGQYQADGSIALFLAEQTGAPYATISEFHEGIALGPNQFVAQTRNMTEALRASLGRCGMIGATGDMVTFGTFGTSEPIWELLTCRCFVDCHGTLDLLDYDGAKRFASELCGTVIVWSGCEDALVRWRSVLGGGFKFRRKDIREVGPGDAVIDDDPLIIKAARRLGAEVYSASTAGELLAVTEFLRGAK